MAIINIGNGMNIDITNIISGFAVKKSKKPDFSFQKMIDSEV